MSSPNYIWGVSCHPKPREALEQLIASAHEAGLNTIRYELPWRMAQDITDKQNVLYRQIKHITDAGLSVIPILANGFCHWLPDDISPGSLYDTTTQQQYIKQASQHVMTCTNVLNDLGVTIYQVENELNAAGMARMPPYSWRKGSAWHRESFKTELIKTLCDTVRTAAPSAILYTNFHNRISDPPHRLKHYMTTWMKHFDWAGLDFYQEIDFFKFDWNDALLKHITNYKKWSDGKPVFISETGYPSQGYGHNIKRQSQFVQQIIPLAKKHAIGMIYLHLIDRIREEQVPSKQTGLNRLGPLHRLEPYWGLIDQTGNPKSVTEDDTIICPWETFKTNIKAMKSCEEGDSNPHGFIH